MTDATLQTSMLSLKIFNRFVCEVNYCVRIVCNPGTFFLNPGGGLKKVSNYK